MKTFKFRLLSAKNVQENRKNVHSSKQIIEKIEGKKILGADKESYSKKNYPSL